MPVSIERLRSSLLVLAVLLAAGIVLALAYARWRARRAVRDLPAKLGLSIQRSSNGFDVSKSEGGRTLFTLHAAKMVEYTGAGRAALRDVSITLYGPDGAPTDHIYGDDFAYDPVGSVVRANGAVRIDLEGPASNGAAGGKNIVHVKTADLIFNQKTGLASTSRPIAFRIADDTGSATGASFDAHTRVCILDSQVVFDSNMQGKPVHLIARHAQFDRANHRLYLLDGEANYESAQSRADEATILFRDDGSAYRIDLQGHVKTVKDGQSLLSPRAQVSLGAQNRPEQVFVSQGVLYSAKEPTRSVHGSAVSGVLSFGPDSEVRHAQLKNAVSIVEDETPPPPALASRPGESRAKYVESISREAEASQLDVDFEQSRGRSVASRILAVGGAALKARTLYANSPSEQTEIHGDRILATLRDGTALSTVRGTGHTELVTASSDGVTQTSTGDRLSMDFAPPAKASPRTRHPTAVLTSAEQQGDVVFTQQGAPKGPTGSGANGAGTASSSGKPPAAAPLPAGAEIRATAQRALYNAATDQVTLSGAGRGPASQAGGVNPRVEEVGGSLTATTIVFARATGDATATGEVKATYRQQPGSPAVAGFGGAQPVHVIAARARLDHAKDRTLFYGAAGADARLWQGANSVSAPVLELAGSEHTLAAHGASPGGQPVKFVLLSGGAAGFAPPSKPAPSPKSAPNSRSARSQGSAPSEASAEPAPQGAAGVVRGSSGSLLYSDRQSEAQLRGGVRMQGESGEIRSAAMDVYLGPAKGAGGSGSSAEQVERIVARGQVVVEQPGRRATGSELVYTASDGKFVLTGSGAAPPRLTDQTHGELTGTSLIFNNRDDSVIVSGQPSRAETETKK